MTRSINCLPISASIVLALCVCGLGAAAQARIVALDIDIALDKTSPEEKNIAVGQHHEARVFYDDTKIDPVTHRVALLHEQHTPALIPKHLNPGQMPMSNAWLDFSGKPIRYHFAAAPTVGFPFPYFILFDDAVVATSDPSVPPWVTTMAMPATPVGGPAPPQSKANP